MQFQTARRGGNTHKGQGQKHPLRGFELQADKAIFARAVVVNMGKNKSLREHDGKRNANRQHDNDRPSPPNPKHTNLIPEQTILFKREAIFNSTTNHTLDTNPMIYAEYAPKEKHSMDKPVITLFMLMSVDGKISTGSIDERDVDRDFPKIMGISEGFKQYYEIEQTTDVFSINSGKVMAKVGVNSRKENIKKIPVSFIVIDSKPHLTDTGVNYFIEMAQTFYLVTTNKNHPAFKYRNAGNLEIIHYENRIDFVDLFKQFKCKYGIEKMTLQTGGTLNSVILREKLIDKISIVVAPALIGGKDTPALIDGESIQSFEELTKIKALKLTDVVKLNNSYINLKYDVINETKIVN
jgi:2,5-diamino-6-(ribosylamino)-4(3H)-pyrimidinone 5'-phosphate reductase